VSNQPLTNPGVDANGALTYRMRSSGGELLTKTFEKTAGFGDVWRMQLGLRYSFK
jgi:hypothetical protein